MSNQNCSSGCGTKCVGAERRNVENTEREDATDSYYRNGLRTELCGRIAMFDVHYIATYAVTYVTAFFIRTS